MATTYTTNYNMSKPDGNENIATAVQALDSNFDILDAALKPTADPTQVPTGLTGNVGQWVSWITNRIKAITGETNWFDEPDTTLSTAATFISGIASTIRGTVLTGLSTATSAVVAATDSVIVAIGKLQAQVSLVASSLTTHAGNTNNPHNVTTSQISAVPTSRQINGHALSGDLTLVPKDLNAITGYPAEVDTAAWTDTVAKNGGTLTKTLNHGIGHIPSRIRILIWNGQVLDILYNGSTFRAYAYGKLYRSSGSPTYEFLVTPVSLSSIGYGGMSGNAFFYWSQAFSLKSVSVTSSGVSFVFENDSTVTDWVLDGSTITVEAWS